MDFISHGLWPVAVFPNARWKWKAALFGILPDVGMFGPLMYLFAQDGIRQIKWIIPFIDKTGLTYLTPSIPDVWMASYFAFHSLVVWLFVVGLFVLIKKRMYWPLIGWGMHILFDMFLHAGRYATQIFFPLSDWSVSSSLGWQDKRVLLLNWIVLLILFGLFALRRLQKKSA
jgi:hypothetical protein